MTSEAENKNLNCEKIQALMQEALDGGSAIKKVKEHIKNCNNCLNIWNELSEVRDELLEAGKNISPPVNFASGILNSIEKLEKKNKEVAPALDLIKGPIGIAIFFLLSLGLGVFLGRLSIPKIKTKTQENKIREDKKKSPKAISKTSEKNEAKIKAYITSVLNLEKVLLEGKKQGKNPKKKAIELKTKLEKESLEFLIFLRNQLEKIPLNSQTSKGKHAREQALNRLNLLILKKL
jgi:uncharacterized protein YoaH (UPF0181 family)